MTIKNIGTKIVNIGTTVLMPDATMPANEAICNAPAIKAMVKNGLLSIEKEPAKAPAQAPAQKPAAPKAPAAPKNEAPAAPAAPAADQK